MRVLIVTSTFPLSDNDGLPRFVYDLAVAMAGFCQVTVLAPHHSGALPQETMGSLTVRRFQYAWPACSQRLAYGSGMRENLRASWPARLQIPAYMGALALAVRKLAGSRRYDVINSHWVVPQGGATAMACGRRRAWAHIVTAHAGDISLLERLPMGANLVRCIARRTDLFLPVSSDLGRRLQMLAGRAIRWEVQPMGVDFRRFSKPASHRQAPRPFEDDFILFVGRLVEKKGAACLLDALSLLQSEFPRLGLAVIGSGPMENRLRRRAGTLGIASRVRFIGRLGHREIIAYLHACSVLVVPSMVDARGETDGMPTVLAEALAAGCRVVAGRVAGIEDVMMDGRNGWLAAPGDPVDLARALRQALVCDGNQEAAAARQTACEMDWSRVAANYLMHFEAVIRRRERET